MNSFVKHNSAFLMLGLALAALPLGVASAQTLPYQDAKKPLDARLDDLMGRLTTDEKIGLLGGTGFTTQPIPRLQIPAMVMADAGQGVRGGPDSTLGPATAFPSGVAMASTWNPALVGQLAAAIGVEAQNKGTGVQVMLGPAVNIHRSPLGGRNGEYFSEDPFLAARLAVGYIQGMQGTGTVACIKHFAANNQETDRFGINAVVSERALREIYLPAFEAGVKEGGVWAVMSSYNRLNGPHTSASSYLLTDILKRAWGYDGMVMSDWGGVHAVARTIEAGNDLEMPNGEFLSPAHVKTELERGTITQAQIDQNVRRTLLTVFRSGVVDGLKAPNHALVNSDAHRAIALKAAQESMILLKNQGQTLPLDATKVRSIALIGPALNLWQIGAAGSPGVVPLHQVSPLEGLKNRAGAGVTIRTSSGGDTGASFPAGVIFAMPGGDAGFKAEYFANKKLEGAPTVSRIDPQIDFERPPAGVGPNDWSARWTTTLTPQKSGLTQFFLRADDGCRLFLDGKPLIDHWQDSGATTLPAQANLTAGQKYELRVEYYQGGGDQVVKFGWAEPGVSPYDEAINIARQSDVAIVVVTTRGTEGEGGDRPSFNLPNAQNELIQRVAAVNKKTIVVLNNGTPVAMPWLGSVPALVETWFPGQEGGTALAGVLFGDVNPSGHLPTTLAVRREDYPDYPNFPGAKGEVRYDEGIYVGYRAFDKRGIAPLFPFGYGLSYTNFRIDNLKLSSRTLVAGGTLTATARVTNTGRRAGAQVVQLYVRDPNPKTDKAIRELKGFAKVMLQPGQSQTVSIPLKMRDFAWCDVDARGWRVDAGQYEIAVGDSSRGLTQRATVRVAPSFEPIPFMTDRLALQSAVAGPDLAQGKKVTASSLQEPQYKAEGAVDNDATTRWSSGASDNQWLSVDLGQKERIGRVHLAWEDAYATAYRIEVSDDNQTWTPVYSTDKGVGNDEDIAFAPVEARYIRIFSLKRATNFGSSLWSFEVRAPQK
ncbi:xylan 1,4-beta-xylosidase [Abditibacteriota bacterium]|nr:xylan 1,4-beta-xylosidase [Abditibacteriota bacterium]